MSESTEARVELTPDLLWSLGFRSLTRAQVSDILNDIYDTLELRVGLRIAESLDKNQLANFERVVAGHDESKALAWLHANVPAYREVVRLEFDSIVSTLQNAAVLRKELNDVQDTFCN